MPLVLLAGIATCRSASRTEIPVLPYAERRTLSLSNDIELSYLVAGPADGVPLLFVHGTPGSALDWTRYLQTPPAGFRVVAVDRPGFGATTQAGERALMGSFEEQASVLHELLAAEAEFGATVTKPILVGHSLGGPIIARYAADHPDEVGALVILAGSLDPGLEHPRWYNYVGAVPPISWLLSEDLRISNGEIFAAPQETRLLDEVLARVRCPVVIVHGGKDTLVPFENVAYMQNAFSGAARVEVMGLTEEGHFLPWRNEDVVREAIANAAEAARERSGD